MGGGGFAFQISVCSSAQDDHTLLKYDRLWKYSGYVHGKVGSINDKGIGKIIL